MIQFNNTSTNDGLVQLFEEEVFPNIGDVSSSVTRLKSFTSSVNRALDTYFRYAIISSGTWELDDNNHTDYAVIYATLNSGQRDYSFLTDTNGNAILDIYKVLILPSATSTIYEELEPVDENEPNNIAIIDESNVAGTPTKYAKRSNAVHLGGAIPNYTVARGIKVLINRESSYFTYTDTTKKAGYPYCQEYFYLKPAMEYARRKQLPQYNALASEVLKLEGNPLNGQGGLIAKAYANRKRDEENVISGEFINSK